jgi:hypothetical protein
MDFHEVPDDYSDRPAPAPKPPKYPCSQCPQVFDSEDDLAVHLFDGHVTSRPVLMLRGRECGRSRLAVISKTSPQDWQFLNSQAIRVNGKRCSERDAQKALCATSAGVVAVTLEGDTTDQQFEFSFRIANSEDLDGVDRRLDELVGGRSLTIHSINTFITRTVKYKTARYYRDGLANYFYGVLAREKSLESGLLRGSNASDVYRQRFDDAVEELGRFDRPAAEAICGLVAFHYNQFDLAMRKTRSPRVARIAQRFEKLISARPDSSVVDSVVDKTSRDYVLSDNETERIIAWCSIPLDGTCSDEVADIEHALAGVQATDAVKLRVIAAEHHLAAGNAELGIEHVAVLRYSRDFERWSEWYRKRAGIMSP